MEMYFKDFFEYFLGKNYFLSDEEQLVPVEKYSIQSEKSANRQTSKDSFLN
jgi:hypothetical protein